MKLQQNTFIVFLILVYLLGQWGCATGRYEYPAPEPLSEVYRVQLGTIGVTTGQEDLVIQFDRPLPAPPERVLARIGRGYRRRG